MPGVNVSKSVWSRVLLSTCTQQNWKKKNCSKKMTAILSGSDTAECLMLTILSPRGIEHIKHVYEAVYFPEEYMPICLISIIQPQGKLSYEFMVLDVAYVQVWPSVCVLMYIYIHVTESVMKMLRYFLCQLESIFQPNGQNNNKKIVSVQQHMNFRIILVNYNFHLIFAVRPSILSAAIKQHSLK